MNRNGLFIFALIILFASCGEYNKILKSTDYEMKYTYAKQYFKEKKYSKAYTLLDELVPIFKGTEKAEESLYMLAQSYFGAKDYMTSGQYFTTFYNTYPKGEYAELARFYAGYGYYLDSPEAKLDQSGTYKAINELQMFIEYYPKSDKVKEAQQIIFELQDKLVQKELLSATLYYNLGNYQASNHYISAVITAENALKDYPYTKYKEDLIMVVLRSKFEEANQSTDEKKIDRYRDVVDEYYSYNNEFPDGKHKKEAKQIFEAASKKIKD